MSTLEYQTPPARVGITAAFGWQEWLKRLGPLVGLAFVVIVFSALTRGSFLSAFNLRVLLIQTAVVGTAVLGMTLIIVSGGIDLSVGSNVAMCSVIVALLLSAGLNPVVAALGGIAMGMAVGLLIGLLVTKLQLQPFIVTLGLMGALRGAAIGTAGESGVVYPPPALRHTWIGRLLSLQGDSPWVAIPPGVWVMLVLALIVAGILRYTKFGRHVFAIGSNEQTARLCGVKIDWTKIKVYTLAGLLVGIAAVMQFSRPFLGDATTAAGLELDVIAAAVIGGASLSGGEGTILGSLAGALMMSAVATGCGNMGWKNWVQQIVTGVIIIIAASLDRLRHRKTS